jgi:ABC-type transport system involved in Fe-S cluster assembly fused permease/ATPase subunit
MSYLRFHIKRKLGDLLRVMDRGTSSIGFTPTSSSISPCIHDTAIAVIYFNAI